MLQRVRSPNQWTCDWHRSLPLSPVHNLIHLCYVQSGMARVNTPVRKMRRIRQICSFCWTSEYESFLVWPYDSSSAPGPTGSSAQNPACHCVSKPHLLTQRSTSLTIIIYLFTMQKLKWRSKVEWTACFPFHYTEWLCAAFGAENKAHILTQNQHFQLNEINWFHNCTKYKIRTALSISAAKKSLACQVLGTEYRRLSTAELYLIVWCAFCDEIKLSIVDPNVFNAASETHVIRIRDVRSADTSACGLRSA